MVGPPFGAFSTRTMASADDSSNPLHSTPPEASPYLIGLFRVAGRPLERFLRIEAASGVLLLVAAAVALGCANSPWAASYAGFWHTTAGLRLGSFVFERSLEWVVNDGLMVVFFFVVGLEIRREIYCGELSEWRRAALPAAAALGGMVAPALLYLALAGAAETRAGWGVPMATDIAFAVGILTLLGKRVPAALRVLLLALAVIDDLGAILVIALFYSSGVSPAGVLVAAAGLASVIALQRLGVRSKLAYVPSGLLAWAGTYAAGVHPTIAGVVLGLMTPVRAWLGTQGFVAGVRHQIRHLEQAPLSLSAHEIAGRLKHVDQARREALSPAESLIQSLHPWVAFAIMPIFALANAGVALGGEGAGTESTTVVVAVVVGLVVGKPLGVLLTSWVMLKAGLSSFPTGVTWRHLVVLGTVAGVGFTMALFIAQLAFSDAGLLSSAKVGVLAASAGAGVLALVLGRALLPAVHAPSAAKTADEAEASTEH
jgi:NhaA family Na+:H+ antiporter